MWKGVVMGKGHASPEHSYLEPLNRTTVYPAGCYCLCYYSQII